VKGKIKALKIMALVRVIQSWMLSISFKTTMGI